MIDWPTNLPAGAKAHIFWPAISSKDVIILSARLVGGSFISAEDANPVVFDALPGFVACISIPALQMTARVGKIPTTKQNYTSLLTIDLPTSVTRDAKLNVLVRRITKQSKTITLPPTCLRFSEQLAQLQVALLLCASFLEPSKPQFQCLKKINYWQMQLIRLRF